MKTAIGALAKDLMDENYKLRAALRRLYLVAGEFEQDSLAAALDQAAEALGESEEKESKHDGSEE